MVRGRQGHDRRAADRSFGPRRLELGRGLIIIRDPVGRLHHSVRRQPRDALLPVPLRGRGRRVRCAGATPGRRRLDHHPHVHDALLEGLELVLRLLDGSLLLAGFLDLLPAVEVEADADAEEDREDDAEDEAETRPMSTLPLPCRRPPGRGPEGPRRAAGKMTSAVRRKLLPTVRPTTTNSALVSLSGTEAPLSGDRLLLELVISDLHLSPGASLTVSRTTCPNSPRNRPSRTSLIFS